MLSGFLVFQLSGRLVVRLEGCPYIWLSRFSGFPVFTVVLFYGCLVFRSGFSCFTVVRLYGYPVLQISSIMVIKLPGFPVVGLSG